MQSKYSSISITDNINRKMQVVGSPSFYIGNHQHCGKSCKHGLPVLATILCQGISAILRGQYQYL